MLHSEKNRGKKETTLDKKKVEFQKDLKKKKSLQAQWHSPVLSAWKAEAERL